MSEQIPWDQMTPDEKKKTVVSKSKKNIGSVP